MYRLENLLLLLPFIFSIGSDCYDENSQQNEHRGSLPAQSERNRDTTYIGQSNTTTGRLFALHASNAGPSLELQYGSPNLTGVISEQKALSITSCVSKSEIIKQKSPSH